MQELKRWTCAGCGRAFKIPAGKTPPEMCRDCRAAAGAVQPPRTTADELAALALEPLDTHAVPPPLPEPVERAVADYSRRSRSIAKGVGWGLLTIVHIAAILALGLIALLILAASFNSS